MALFDYLPINMKIPASKAITPSKSPGIATAAIDMMPTRIRYIAKRIKPMLFINLMTKLLFLFLVK